MEVEEELLDYEEEEVVNNPTVTPAVDSQVAPTSEPPVSVSEPIPSPQSSKRHRSRQSDLDVLLAKRPRADPPAPAPVSILINGPAQSPVSISIGEISTCLLLFLT